MVTNRSNNKKLTSTYSSEVKEVLKSIGLFNKVVITQDMAQMKHHTLTYPSFILYVWPNNKIYLYNTKIFIVQDILRDYPLL